MKRDLFGHPVGLSFLSGTELWERFSYYGMRALLTFYMVDFLFLGTEPSQVLGYGPIKQGSKRFTVRWVRSRWRP